MPTKQYKTHCKRGHEYTPDNTIWKSRGRRNCRACKQLSGGAYWQKPETKSRRRKIRMPEQLAALLAPYLAREEAAIIDRLGELGRQKERILNGSSYYPS